MLTALPEPGTLQIWTGLMVRTLPGWHILVRAPANLPLTGGFVLYEGIVEADTWFGPLFTNLRFTRTHSPITLRPDFPLLQVQPVAAATYADEVLNATELVPAMDGLAEADWHGYHQTIVIPNEDPDRPFGAYAKQARRRRKAGGDPRESRRPADSENPLRSARLSAVEAVGVLLIFVILAIASLPFCDVPTPGRQSISPTTVTAAFTVV